MPETIKCRFNLFEEGRKYTGHHRKYILENARNICYAPETREGLRLREKLGYFGHGRRQMAGKVQIAETERVEMPDGSMAVIENVPSSVTTFFEIDKAGNVDHHQEVLTETQPGKIVSALNKSKIGGFSWAMGGQDGGPHSATRVSSFEGFDYVMNPGFSANRGYILESADSVDMVLEGICKSGVDEAVAGKYLESWKLSAQTYAIELEDRLANAEVLESALVENNEKLTEQVSQLIAQLNARRELVTECAKTSTIVVPQEVKDALISMASESDFRSIMAFFESATAANLSRYPLPGNALLKKAASGQNGVNSRKESTYGSAAAGVIFDKSMPFSIKL